MSDTLNIIAIIMVSAWAIGFFALNIGGLAHILLVLALVAFLANVFHRRKEFKLNSINNQIN